MIFANSIDTFFNNLDHFNHNFGESFGNWASEHLFNIIVILFVGWLVRKFGPKLIMKAINHTVRPGLYPSKSDRTKRLKTLESMIQAIFGVGTWLVIVLLVISELRPKYTTALFTSAGVVGVALGIGAQSLIKDFMSGLFIISENQYRVGDNVTLRVTGSNNLYGTVIEIGMRTTALRDVNGDLHHVPNGSIVATTNETMGYGGVSEDIALPAKVDMEKFAEAVEEVGKKLMAKSDLALVIKEPPFVSEVKGFKDEGMIVTIKAKTEPGKQWKVRSEMYQLLRKELEKNKIPLPK